MWLRRRQFLLLNSVGHAVALQRLSRHALPIVRGKPCKAGFGAKPLKILSWLGRQSRELSELNEDYFYSLRIDVSLEAGSPSTLLHRKTIRSKPSRMIVAR